MDRSYVPAMGIHALTRFYDPLVALTMREQSVKGRLIDQARIAPGHDVLDVGCGTGTLALMIAAREPKARVVGLDGDPAILAIARKKIAKAGADVKLVEGLADDASRFERGSFDRIVTSFVLHHLTTPQKRAALAAMRHWLKPAGEVHVLDFDGPGTGVWGFVLRTFGALHGHTHQEPGASVPELAREVGFANVNETGRVSTPFGGAAYWRAA
jgi:ubiquinone/menaquinone biosynthesis C-methylase UbiE